MKEQKHETRARKAKMAIRFITCGTLMVVWSIIWLLYLLLPQDISGSIYIASGVILSGIAVVLIGMKVGEIGREANQDEDAQDLPPSPEIKSTRKTDPSTVTTGTEEPSQIELDTGKTATW